MHWRNVWEQEVNQKKGLGCGDLVHIIIKLKVAQNLLQLVFGNL